MNSERRGDVVQGETEEERANERPNLLLVERSPLGQRRRDSAAAFSRHPTRRSPRPRSPYLVCGYPLRTRAKPRLIGATGLEPATLGPHRRATGVDASLSVPRVPVRGRSGRIGRSNRYQGGTTGRVDSNRRPIRFSLPPTDQGANPSRALFEIAALHGKRNFPVTRTRRPSGLFATQAVEPRLAPLHVFGRLGRELHCFIVDKAPLWERGLDVLPARTTRK